MLPKDLRSVRSGGPVRAARIASPRPAVDRRPLVLCLVMWLASWRCRRAATCLPITPTFVLPSKRYAGPTLLHLAAVYLEDDRPSCRETVSPGGRPTTYQAAPGAPLEERGLLDHSTLWWMLT